MVLPIAERHLEYAQKLRDRLKEVGVRVELADDNTLNYRIRQAQTQKVPYMLVLGDREVESSTVSIRLRTGENLDPMSVDEVASMMVDTISSKMKC